MPIDLKRLQSVFLASLESPDRTALLDRECAGDAELRRRVDKLLAAHDDSEPLPAAPDCTTDYAPITERLGSRIGPYRLMEQIGEGGFGLVFVAEQQEPVKRKVALKVIKPGMDTGQVIARFQAERQALALMDHPNIARVLDAGVTESGRPYFVMELVRGISITDYCDKNQLAPKERLELFVTVCQAVQHAHQKGIIHRDIKPSNVLVTAHDGKPLAKIIDFGVAKAINQQLTDRTIYTNFAQMIGTPLYMSPEQAEMTSLDIDTRTDIYSLGVLLYELLTGTTPLDKKRFAKAAYDEIRRMIREDDPQKPSTRLSTTDSIASVAAQRHMDPTKLSKLIRGDLDWITMKALEKDRTRRYETANGLARDIQRYLSDEPVEACPPSSTYRLRKFAKKNRAVLTTASVIALLLLGGIAVSTWQAIRATRAEHLALAARQAEVEQRQLAETNAGQARTAAEAEKKSKEEAQTREAETKAVLDFVQNRIFAAARPKGQDGGRGYDVSLADALQAALKHGDTSFAAQPLIEARLRMTLGQSFMYLGRSDIAEAQFRRARELYTARLGADHPDTLHSISNVANSYTDLGRSAEALKLREEVLAVHRSRFGPDHPNTLASMTNLADSYASLKHNAKALKLREEVFALHRVRFGPDHPSTLVSMINLANSYGTVGRHAEALKLREETFALSKGKLGPQHPSTLMAMNNLASSYADVGRHAECLKLMEETLTLSRATLGPEHPNTVMTMNNVADGYAAVGRHAEAAKLCEEALPLVKAKLGPEHSAVLHIMNTLASAYRAGGQLDPAVRVLRECLALREKTLPDDFITFYTQSVLGAVLLGQKKYAEAEPLLIRGYEGMKAREANFTKGEGWPLRIPEALDRLIEIYTATNKPDEVKKWKAERAKYPAKQPAKK